MTIVCDTREPTDIIKDMLASWYTDIPEVQFRKLDIADYLIENNGTSMLIERKTLPDFCSSLSELVTRRDTEWPTVEGSVGLITEGNYTVQDGSIWLWRGNKQYRSLQYSQFRNFIESIQQRGYYYHHTLNLNETIQTLICLHNYTEHIHTVKTKHAVSWIAELPGMGDIKTWGLTDRYASPIDALVSAKEWLPKRAKNMLAKW